MSLSGLAILNCGSILAKGTVLPYGLTLLGPVHLRPILRTHYRITIPVCSIISNEITVPQFVSIAQFYFDDSVKVCRLIELYKEKFVNNHC